MRLTATAALALGAALAGAIAGPGLAQEPNPAVAAAPQADAPADEGGADELTDLLSLLGADRAKGAKLEALIDEAGKHPLGSRKNPIRVNMPAGQRSYLGRLRCPDDTAPAFSRDGSVGIGPYGSILDVYSVICPGDPPRLTKIFMDMYHPDHIETAPPEGFTAYKRSPQR